MGGGGRDSALSAHSAGGREVESRSSFFATPDPLAPGSPHAALQHMRPLSVLSPSHGETDDELRDDPRDAGDEHNDTYALSPDSARGLRQWRCWHTMHLPSADKPEPVRMLAVTSLGGAGGGAGGGGYLLACGLGNGTVEIWDCLTWACISTTPLAGTPSALLWRVGGVPGSPAALFCACGQADIYMLLPNAMAGPLSGPLPWNVHRLQGACEDGSDGIALCLCWCDGLLCAGTNNGLVQVWDTLSYTVTARLRHAGAVYCLSASPASPALLVTATPEGISVWQGSAGAGWRMQVRLCGVRCAVSGVRCWV